MTNFFFILNTLQTANFKKLKIIFKVNNNEIKHAST